MIIGVDTLPVLPTDPGDRNRTSPFAFTGNRFEFRAPGSMQTVGGADGHAQHDHGRVAGLLATELEKAVADGDGLQRGGAEAARPTIITEHGAVVFNGDGYSEDWQIEAAQRGLPNLQAPRSTRCPS